MTIRNPQPGWYVGVRFDHERLHRVVEFAASLWNIPSSRIMSRSHRDADARQAVCAVLYDLGDSYAYIGRFLGRDHTTVLHSVRQAATRARADKSYRVKLLELARYGKEFASKL